VTSKGRRDHLGGHRGPSGSRTVNLGGGRVVPYPEPTSEAATSIGKANRRTGTKPEVRLRSALHRRGHRFRKDHLLRAGTVRVRPDVVFTRQRLVVFVDGCFWHGCPEHQHLPRSNRDYWVPKLAANVERDRRVDAALTEAGWAVLRLWEHVDVDTAVDLVERSITAQQDRPGRRARDAT
jgi:DNA mismatch endonuclease (patch repair protein)